MRIHQRIILLAVMAGLIGGCQDTTVERLRYEAEKIAFEAEASMSAFALRPDAATVEARAELRGIYGDALAFCYDALEKTDAESYPQDHSQLADLTFHCASRLSQMYFAEKSFDSAAAVLDDLISRVPVRGVAKAGAWVSYGLALQATGQFDSALVVYDRVLSTFYPPVNSDGSIVTTIFSLPTKILNLHSQLGDTEATRRQFDEAETYYLRLTRDFAGSQVAVAAHTNLAGLYEGEQRWTDAIYQLEQLADTSGAPFADAVIRIAGLLANRMNQPDSAMAIYDKLLTSLVGRDTLQRPSLLYHKSQALMVAKKFAGARSILNDLRNHYPRFYAASPNIQHAIAVTFEAENNWERAETEYRYLIEKFAESVPALAAYLHLADYYFAQGRDVEAEHMESEAVAEYQRIGSQYSGRILEARALSYLAELHRRRSEWEPAAQTLAELYRKFPQISLGRQAAGTAIGIYRNELGNSAAADSLLHELKSALAIDETTEM